MDDHLIQRYADVIVRSGANVQPGQTVDILTELGNETLLRAVADRAFEVGAHYVQTSYTDPWVTHSRIRRAPVETLGIYPAHVGERVLALGRERAASIWLSGAVERTIMDDLPPERIGAWRPPGGREVGIITNDRTVNWTVAGAPNTPWACDVYPDAESDEEALRLLWQDIAFIARLDTDDPAAAWHARIAELRSVAGRLDELELDAVRFVGPGTDLTVALLPSSSWTAGSQTTVDGIEHIVNIPTEEIFTTPDPTRTEGVVRATRPLEQFGATIEGLEVRFEDGRVVSVQAERGADVLRGRTEADEGAARLGEVALVDGQTRVGQLGRVFRDTLFDENASSHIALGSAYASPVGEEDRRRINDSSIHIDFMIGGDDVETVGLSRDGREIPLLRGGAWQI